MVFRNTFSRTEFCLEWRLLFGTGCFHLVAPRATLPVARFPCQRPRRQPPFHLQLCPLCARRPDRQPAIKDRRMATCTPLGAPTTNGHSRWMCGVAHTMTLGRFSCIGTLAPFSSPPEISLPTSTASRRSPFYLRGSAIAISSFTMPSTFATCTNSYWPSVCSHFVL